MTLSFRWTGDRRVRMTLVVAALTLLSAMLVGSLTADAATHVQSANGTKKSSETAPTVVSATFAAPATFGNMLVAVVGASGTTTITGPSGWLTAINQSGTPSQAIFYKRAAGGETVVSATVSANPNSLGLHVYEYSGATTFMSAGTASGNSATPTSGSVSTASSNELILAAFTTDQNSSITNGSWNDASEGFSERQDFKTSGGGRDATYAGGDKLTNSIGSHSVTVTSASGNWRGQIVRFENDVTAPSAVSDLSLADATTTSITLNWTAPGDDGSVGTANSYDIRYSTAPINGNFASASAISGEPAPAAAGTSQSMVVSGLSPGTTYYFAIKTSDEIPNVSPISNVPSLATATPPDTTAPVAVTDLSASGATVSSVDLDWTSPGDDGAIGTAASYDIRYATFPIASDGDFASATPVSGEPTPSLSGSSDSMTVSGLSSDTTYYFAMKSSDEVPNISALSNYDGLATLPPPDTTAPDTITDLELSDATVSTVTLTWTAPGDDGATGTAALYDIHYATSPILTLEDFDEAADISPHPASPQAAGSAETITATGLSADTTYYFAILVHDEVPNYSGISNSPGMATTTPPDSTPPAAVADLALSLPTTTSLTVAWTAPGDDGSTGTATTYDLRYSTAPITSDGEYGDAARITGEPSPSVAGSAESMIVSGLSPSTTYYFALKTWDESSNLSDLSNVPSGMTSTPPDATPPAAITDLELSDATTDTITLTWTASGDDGSSGTADRYDIRYNSEYPIDSDDVFLTSRTVTGEPTPAVSGTEQSMTISALRPNTNYWFSIKAIDESSNAAGLSNSPNASTLPEPDTTAPAAIASLVLSDASPHSITLTWTAPGDDGSSGTAAYYDIHYATFQLNAANFETGTHVYGEPSPAIAGTEQTMEVTELAADTTYYFAIRTGDEIPNLSGISNVPSLATPSSPDTTAPAAVSDLVLSDATTSTITLTWTAPGDDGSSGTASSYDIRYSLAPINGNFASATEVVSEPTPAVAGTEQTMTITGLSDGTTYYFALKSSDEVPNVSGVSNIPSLATEAMPDVTPPDAVIDLSGASYADGQVTLTWTAPGDDGSVGTADSYDIRYSHSSIVTNADFSLATPVIGEPVPSVAGTEQSVTLSGFDSDTVHFFAMRAVDDATNASGISNVVSVLAMSGSRGSSTRRAVVEEIGLSVTVQPVSLPIGGGEVKFSYEVNNPGYIHLSEVEIRGDLGTIPCAPHYVSGDEDEDGFIDPGKSWRFECITTVTASGTHVAQVSGIGTYGRSISPSAAAVVIVGDTTSSANFHFHARTFPSVLHPGGGMASIEFTVGNLGDTPLSDLSFGGAECDVIGPLHGDENGNGVVDRDEHWHFACERAFDASTTFAVTLTAKAGDVTLVDIASVQISVGHAEAHPNIHLHASSNPTRLPAGGGRVLLTYRVSNDGSVPLTDIVLATGSDECPAPELVEGDLNLNSILELNEIWMFGCETLISGTIADAAQVTGRAGDTMVSDDALFVVPVATTIPPAVDVNAAGSFDPSAAVMDTPDVDTSLGLTTLVGFDDCVVGVPYKLADDHDLLTQEDTTVYYCGRDGRRHPFLNANVYRSWFADFKNVVVMERARLLAIPFGEPVTYRPGARMIKRPEASEVYAVARGGLLRWVVSEIVAERLYGRNWRLMIDDMAAAFWSDYVIGEDIK